MCEEIRRDWWRLKRSRVGFRHPCKEHGNTTANAFVAVTVQSQDGRRDAWRAGVSPVGGERKRSVLAILGSWLLIITEFVRRGSACGSDGGDGYLVRDLWWRKGGSGGLVLE